MPDTAPVLILYPAFAMFLLVALVLARMAQLRFAAVGKQAMNPEYYRTYQAGEEPDELRVFTRNFINLFEVPVLFYVGVVLVYITGQVNTWLIVLAWLYVALRYLHTYIHLTSNDVMLRFKVYASSGLVLFVLWASLFLQLVSQA